MSSMSSGRVSVSPFRATGDVTLEELQDGLAKLPPDGGTQEAGWAEFDPQDINLRSYGTQPPSTSPPRILDAEGVYPKRLIARYYFWSYDGRREALLTAAGMSPSDLEVRQLDAVDVIISEEGNSEGFLVLVSSRTESEIGAVLASLRSVFSSIDEDSSLAETTRSSLHVGSGDFFLWLVERKETAGQIHGDLTIATATALDTRDSSSRLNLLKNDIDSNRVAFLTAVVDGDDLGPLRFSIRIPSVPARIALQLWADGSFVLLTSDTHYSLRANVENEPVQAVHDLAYKHLPALIAAHSADTEWPSFRRKEFRKAARKKLAKRYAGKRT